MNVYNQLLYWLSERSEVSRGCVNEACQELAPSMSHPVPRLLDPLRRLGHVEYNQRRCLTVDPCLMEIHKRQGLYTGVFCGRRDVSLLECLKSCSSFSVVEQDYGPDLWLLSAGEEETWQLLDELSIPLQACPTDPLLDKLPSLSKALLCTNPVTSVQVTQRYHGGQWYSCKTLQGSGLYKDGCNHFYYQDAGVGAIYRLADRELVLIAKWHEAVGEDRVLLRHNALGQCLTLAPKELFLPVVLDRLLRARTGRCPARDCGEWIYESIQRHQALQVARILEVDLEEE